MRAPIRVAAAAENSPHVNRFRNAFVAGVVNQAPAWGALVAISLALALPSDAPCNSQKDVDSNLDGINVCIPGNVDVGGSETSL